MEMEKARPLIAITRSACQTFSLFLIVTSAMVLVVGSGLALAGLLPWLDLPLSVNGAPVAQAGMYAQLAVTALLLSLCFFVPTNHRVMRLEAAHHGFSMRMEDVTRAYALAHAEDRKGVFQATAEYDAVKERMVHLRDHPDLGSLEPDLLEVAAQMSQISQNLAQAYADEKVDRARDFLVQRQQEVAQFQERLDHAKALNCDIRQWLNRVEMDEAVAQSQLDRLIGELDDVLPEARTHAKEASGRVVRLSNLAAE